MVLLNPVVEPTATPVLDEAPQLAFALQIPQCTGVAVEPVGDDHLRVTGVLVPEGFLEEAPGGFLVPLGAEQEVDRLAAAVDPAPATRPLTTR